jgi:hypothetical protein
MKIFLPVAAVLLGGSALLVDALDSGAADARAAKHAIRPKVQLGTPGRAEDNPRANHQAETGPVQPAPSR